MGARPSGPGQQQQRRPQNTDHSLGAGLSVSLLDRQQACSKLGKVRLALIVDPRWKATVLCLLLLCISRGQAANP